MIDYGGLYVVNKVGEIVKEPCCRVVFNTDTQEIEADYGHALDCHVGEHVKIFCAGLQLEGIVEKKGESFYVK